MENSDSSKFNNNHNDNSRKVSNFNGFVPMQYSPQQYMGPNQPVFVPNQSGQPIQNGHESNNGNHLIPQFSLIPNGYQNTPASGGPLHINGNYSYNQQPENIVGDFSPSPTYNSAYPDRANHPPGSVYSSNEMRRRASVGYQVLSPSNANPLKKVNESYHDMEIKSYKNIPTQTTKSSIDPKSRRSGSPKLINSPRSSTKGRRRSSVSSTASSATNKTRRSRNGCLTCRLRKKKCCETRPQCAECSRLSIRCRWPTPGSERRNRSKNNLFNHDEMKHEIYGTIKILRGVVDYKIEG